MLKVLYSPFFLGALFLICIQDFYSNVVNHESLWYMVGNLFVAFGCIYLSFFSVDFDVKLPDEAEEK